MTSSPPTFRRAGQRRPFGRFARPAAVAVIVALAVSMAACGERRDPTVGPLLTSPAAAEMTTETDIEYREVDGESLAVDACLPADGGAPTAAVILLHGGGFVSGSRADESISNLCLWLAENGYAAFPTSYRFAPTYIYPSQTEDVAAAVEWLRESAQAERFNIDPARIGALGSSAGAILALEAATAGEGPSDTGSRLKAAVSLSGVADMTSEAAMLGTPSPEALTIILTYLGCTTITRCDGANASAVNHIDATDAPVLFVGAEQDLVPTEQADSMAAALQTAGVPHEVVVVPGAGHGAQLMNQDVRTRTLAFFATYL